ncbi:MAG: hypothetical protein MR296_03910 [Tenericutes bacterium]|nr:hypothetical protein [Mycoplasmatota bacterium]
MNRRIELKKNTVTLFIINVLLLLLLILLKTIYTKLNYWVVPTNIMLVLNILTLIIGIVFNVLYIVKDGKYDDKKYFTLPIVIFILLQVFNIFGVYIINKVRDSSYLNMTETVTGYCDTKYYYCDSYEIKKNADANDFILTKTYYDNNKKKNKIIIHTKYSTSSIISVTATIYSEKNYYSEFLIRESLKDYFNLFDYDISEDKIKDAFNNRFEGSIKDNNANYKVREVYNKNKELEKLKTVISLKVS